MSARARPALEARVLRADERRKAPPPEADALTPAQALVRAAEQGQFEALVAKAQLPPVAMVTPEEREAELRRTGQWRDEPKPKPKRKPRKKKPAPEPGMPTEPTPGMLWAEEHIHRGRRGLNRTQNHQVGRCLTEYDPLTGELIGDGYIHYEDDE